MKATHLKNGFKIYPPRPSAIVPRAETNIYADRGWCGQLKYNDSRMLLKLLYGSYRPDGSSDDPVIELWNRHGEKLRYHLPDFLRDEILGIISKLEMNTVDTWHLFDGGLLHFKHSAIKDSIVLWDVLVRDDEYLIGTTYRQRYDLLAQAAVGDWCFTDPKGEEHKFGLTFCKENGHIFIPECFQPGKWDEVWELVERVNQDYPQPLLEGLVMKNPVGELELGFPQQNNSSWMSRSRVLTGRHRY